MKRIVIAVLIVLMSAGVAHAAELVQLGAGWSIVHSGDTAVNMTAMPIMSCAFMMDGQGSVTINGVVYPIEGDGQRLESRSYPLPTGETAVFAGIGDTSRCQMSSGLASASGWHALYLPAIGR